MRGPLQEVIGQDSRLYYLEIDVDAFIEPWDDEEVVKQVVVAIAIIFLPGDDALVGLVLDEEEEASYVAELEHGVVIQTVRLVIAIGRLRPDVCALISRVKQTFSVHILDRKPHYVVKLLSGLTHPSQVIASYVVFRHCEQRIVGGLAALALGDVLHGVGEESVVGFRVIVELVGHEGDGELRDFVRLIIEGGAIDLLDGRVVLYEFYEIEHHVGDEDGKEQERADDGSLGG